MFDLKDFNINNNQFSFDFKGFLNKLIGYWKWILITLFIALFVAYQINVRKLQNYKLSSNIALKEESNPLFTNNTSLIFNWGGTSDQVQNIMSTLQSRTHNEFVVDELNLYLNYLKQGKYHLEDVYGKTGYYFDFDKSSNQLIGQLIQIKILENNAFQIEINLEEQTVNLFNFSNFESTPYTFKTNNYKQSFKLGQKINLPFLKGQLVKTNEKKTESEFFIKFDDFDETVKTFKNNIKPETDTKSSSIINLTMVGTNVIKLETYLNQTVRVLIKKQLERKNKFANNTIAFIDSTLMSIDGQIKDNENELKTFNNKVNIVKLESGNMITNQLLSAETERDTHERKIAYYNMLNSYINSKSNDFSNLPAPTVASIEDPNVVVNVSKLIELSNQKLDKSKMVKNPALLKTYDDEMDNLKSIIKENIQASKASIQYDINKANNKINILEGSINRLPTDQQDYLKITRKHNLNNQLFTNFLSKRNEAEIVKASNVSDIQFIDTAKISDSNPIGSNNKLNYILAVFIGILIPVIFIFFIHLYDKKILTIEDITTRTTVPVLGVIGKNTSSPLAVFEKPQSALAESFRSVRSSLQFMFVKNNHNEGKTIMLTSSISGEGKTFCSINLASIYALSNKKTILVGLDLRKPKIFDDFNLNNDVGVVHFLSNQKNLSEIVQKSKIENLDIILSGPIPPNPSELLISDRLMQLNETLKNNYDYIIYDTPPIGLVADALHLSSEVDQTIFVFRQNFSKKEMINLLNIKLKKDELKRVSIILNDFEVKSKYGYGYNEDYGYGYGYGSYSHGYYENDKKITTFARIKKWIRRYV